MSASDPDPPGDADAGAEQADPGPGVLGSLPRTRPSVRSPRRADARAAHRSADPGTEAAEAERGGGREAEVEALARAGISLAGSAATLGLRAAGRAAAALRDAVERR